MEGPKKWVEIALMPLVIAIVGILGTYLITNEQREAAELRATADREATNIRAATDRQLKILDIFASRIISKREEERLLAAQMLLAMDSDLVLKVMTTIDLKEEKSSIVKEAVSRITSHAISLKLAKNKEGAEYRAALLEGQWEIRRQGTGIHEEAVNWLEFSAETNGLMVQGSGWNGVVNFDGKYGSYTWKFGSGEAGTTEFYLDDTGILLGRVKQDPGDGNQLRGLNWTYWGLRVPSTITNP